MKQFNLCFNWVFKGILLLVLIPFLSLTAYASFSSDYYFKQMINGIQWTDADITGCQKLYGTSPQLLAHMPKLTVNAADLASNIPYAKMIWSLKIPDATDDTLKLLDKFPSLQKLDLNYTQVDDNALGTIAKNCPGLKSLKVGWCYITDTGIGYLSKMYLTKLNLSKTYVTDRGLNNLPGGLNKLNLSVCDITDAGLYTIGHQCPYVSRLNLTGCNNITDKGLQNLPEALAKLDIYGSLPKVTDAGIAQLKKRMPQLKLKVVR